MAFPKIFKSKAKEEASKTPTPKSEAPSDVLEKRTRAILPGILLRPHITEKATMLTSQNQYVFEISPQTTKKTIKQAIESLYGVTVEGVHIIKIPAKKRQIRRIIGEKPGYEKAIVKVKAGQKIEVLPK